MNKQIVYLLHIAIWAMMFLSPLTFLRHDADFSVQKYIMFCVSPLTLMITFYVNYLWLVPRYFLSPERRTYWIVNAIMLIALGRTNYLLMSYVHDHFSSALDTPMERTIIEMVFFSVRDIFNVAVAAALATALRLVTLWHRNEEARLEAEKARSEAELKMLRNQINPHFLLNTLNNIYALTAFDAAKAQEAIRQLSRMLRHLLYDNEQPTVALRDEVEFLENYISLMRIRLPASVDVDCKFSVSNPQMQIAPLLFISLVENAFKHGISPTEPSFIHIVITGESDSVCCDITNSNHPKTSGDHSGHGIGLQQVQRRLDIAYHDSHEWQHGVSPDGKTYRSLLRVVTHQ